MTIDIEEVQVPCGRLIIGHAKALAHELDCGDCRQADTDERAERGIDWDDRLGEARPRTFPEMLQYLLDAADADRFVLEALGLRSELAQLEGAVQARALDQSKAAMEPFTNVLRDILAAIREGEIR